MRLMAVIMVIHEKESLLDQELEARQGYPGHLRQH